MSSRAACSSASASARATSASISAVARACATNPVALAIPCQGFLSTFLRRLLLGQPLEIFGDGEQLRDPVYVGDAVEAFLIAGALEHPPSRIFNIGGMETLSLNSIALSATRGIAVFAIAATRSSND